MKSQNLTSRRQEIISKPTSKSVYVRIERVQYICCYLLALEDGGCRKTSWSTWWSSPHQYLLHDASARSPWYIYIDILEAYIYPETADPTVHLNANRILYYIDTCAPDTPFMDSVWFSFSTSHSYCLPRALHLWSLIVFTAICSKFICSQVHTCLWYCRSLLFTLWESIIYILYLLVTLHNSLSVVGKGVYINVRHTRWRG